MEFYGENLYRARGKGRKFSCQLTSSDPYDARLARFIAFPAGVSKARGVTFRKITTSDDVDGFIGR